MNKRGVAFSPHRADLAQHGQRVDEARRPLHCGDASRQLQTLRHVDAPVLRVHRPTQQTDRLAEQRLRRCRRAGGNDRAGTLIADRERVADPAAKGSQHIGRDRSRHGRRLTRAHKHRRRHVGATEQQSKVRRVERCSIDTHDHLAVSRQRDVDALQRQTQRPIRLHKGTQLQASGRDLGHVPIMAAQPEQIDVVRGPQRPSCFGTSEVVVMLPMPSIVETNSSPAVRNCGGVRAPPTPLRVPVKMRSPGSSGVMDESWWMSGTRSHSTIFNL